MRRSLLLFAVFSSASLSALSAGCSAIVQPDGSRLAGGVDAGAVPPTDGGGGVDAGADAGGGPACDGGRVRCGGVCIDVSSDPGHCGGCGMACGAGLACVSGSCACPPGDPGCTTGPREIGDPSDCGAAHARCRADQVCASGECRCRPPLTALPGGRCTDLSNDPENCGMPLRRCPGACFGGICVARCPDATEDCDGSCVDLRRDPRHCGGCGDACAADELCRAGDCRAYDAATGCTTCPCRACEGELGLCCPYPGVGAPICTTGDRCL